MGVGGGNGKRGHSRALLEDAPAKKLSSHPKSGENETIGGGN